MLCVVTTVSRLALLAHYRGNDWHGRVLMLLAGFFYINFMIKECVFGDCRFANVLLSVYT